MWERVMEESTATRGEEGLALSFRLYKMIGYEWPKISIGIYETRRSYRVSIQRRGKDTWWENTTLPKELIDDYIEMLHEVKSKKA